MLTPNVSLPSPADDTPIIILEKFILFFLSHTAMEPPVDLQSGNGGHDDGLEAALGPDVVFLRITVLSSILCVLSPISSCSAQDVDLISVEQLSQQQKTQAPFHPPVTM